MKTKQFSLIVIILLLALGFYYLQTKGGQNKGLSPENISSSGDNIPVVIVPHFDFAKEKRRELLKDVAEKISPKKILIVSVNHFNTGSSDILTADKKWQIQSGELSTNSELFQKIIADQIAESDESAFLTEHGINNLLPDLKESFPEAEYLPIIIKDKTDRAKIDNLASWVENNCSDCLLVASVDFSHYCPRAIAHVHDTFSILALSDLNKEKIWAAESDSPQTLYLSAKFAEAKGAKNFQFFYNANSGDPGGDDDSEVTSVVLGYYSDKQSANVEEPATTFVVAGDAMFDRNVWHNYKDIGLKRIFDNFGTRPFRGTDLALLNLEGPISAEEIDDDWKSGSMVFNFPSATTAALKYININAISLANNHSQNAGEKGLENTRKALSDSEIQYFGKPYGFGEESTLRIEGPIPLSIIGIMALSEFDEGALNTKIKSEKADGRFVIIFPHWGEEYKEDHVASQKNLANEWISAGADMVIGSHPHVVEDFEIINNRPVVYSLGNFVFDQFFSDETQEGLVVAGIITKDKITLSFLPTQEETVRPEFMRGSAKTAKIKSIFDIDSESGFKKLSSDTIEITR